MRIKRVGVWSFTKLFTVLSAVYVGLVWLLYAWLWQGFYAALNPGAVAPAAGAYAMQWATLGGAAVEGVLFGAIWGLLGGPLVALVLNVALGMARGLELEVEGPETDAPLPTLPNS